MTDAAAATRDLVIVTGGGRGIGAATALRASVDGWNVCLVFRDDEEAAEDIAQQCRLNGARTMVARADVSDEAAVQQVFDALSPDLGTLRGLVNNAGIVAPKSPVSKMTVERIRSVLETNVLGSFLCAREAVRRMSLSSGGAGGSIVNVSSRAAILGAAGEYVDYAASKAAVDILTLGLARETAADGIRVNAVRPGLIETTIHAANGDPDRMTRMRPSVPMERIGTPEEVASAIVWLLSDEASYVTGATIDVAGGR